MPGSVLPNHKVTKSNHLVEANYSITLNEQRLILMAISKINPKIKMKEDRTFSISVKDFAVFYGLELKNAYKELYDAVELLWKREVILKDDINEDDAIRWIERKRKKKNESNEGAVTITFTESIQPYLTDLHRAFTTYEIKHIANLSTSYAIRMYELGKQYEDLHKRYYPLDEFKELLKLTGKYDRFTNLKSRVIDPSIKEINKQTDIKMGYKPRRKSRTVIGVDFFIAKSKKELDQQMGENLELFK